MALHFWADLIVPILSVIGLILMAADKYLAVKHRWRIPERTLLSVAALGGSFGSLFGMLLLRHKTRKAPFRYGFPLMAAVHVLLYLYIIRH